MEPGPEGLSHKQRGCAGKDQSDGGGPLTQNRFGFRIGGHGLYG